MGRTIKKILVANRGEIAVRIIRTCREMEIGSVAVYSEADRGALHACLADEAYPLKGSKASETYLNQKSVIDCARKSGCDAVHPGYGFLSENPAFAEAVQKEALSFIGPSPKAIRLLGDKTAARTLAKSLGIPMVKGSDGPLENEEEARAIAADIGFPILFKAAAGGGGKGMRIVEREEEFREAFLMAKSEARNAFGDDRVYIEQYLKNPHHVEIQILGDVHGSLVYLGERDCSIQRRHQKVIEESPSPMIGPGTRERMGAAAVRLAKEAGYANAGTVEFLVDDKERFYFLEVNTRLQVEHPVTEAVTGIDLVRAQILVARGERLPFSQADMDPHGHAIECRLYAEDPSNEFFPSTGRLQRYRLPSGPRIRVDNGAQEGEEVQIHYDPMLAKIVSWGASRGEAIAAMRRALRECEIVGIQTTVPFCEFVLQHPVFIKGEHTTSFVKQYFNPEDLESSKGDVTTRIAASLAGVLFLSESKADRFNLQTSANHTTSRWKSRRAETHQ